MLEDYARYIENIRDGLIQCGVIFPKIDSIVGSDYGSLFYVGESLSEILYFYKIMVCSGNMEELFIPMDKSYRGFVRTSAFKEFTEDILPYLKEQLGDDDPNSCFELSDLYVEEGLVAEEDEPEEWVNEDVPVEDTLFDADDLFGDEDDDSTQEGVEDSFIHSGASLWVSSGTNLFSSPVKSELSYVSRGTELFSISVAKTSEPVVSSVEYVTHGIELFSVETKSSFSGDSYWKVDTSDSFSEDDQDSWVSEEEPFEDEPFEDDQDSWVADEGEEYFSDDDQDSWVADEEEEFIDDSSQDSWVPDPEEEPFEDDLDSWVADESDDVFEPSDDDVQDSWVADEEDDYFFPEATAGSSSDSSSTEKPVSASPKPVVVQPKQPKSSNDCGEERDIVDTVQDAASAALTSAKRFILNITNPKK